MSRNGVVFAGFLLLLLVLLLTQKGESRYLGSYNSSFASVSDGLNDNDHSDQSPHLELLKPLESFEDECVHMYGFLPCTNNLLGHLYQIIVYECFLFFGERFVSLGSDMVFTILGTGYFGASVFHILGSLPQAFIVIVSGISSKSKEMAQQRVMTGVGSLAGSTTFLLTFLWGTCLYFGKRELPSTSSSESIDSNCETLLDSPTPISSNTTGTSTSQVPPFGKRLSFSLTGTGVTIDPETKITARIMFISLVPFIVLQIPVILKLQSLRHIVTLVALIVSVSFLLGYFYYQIFESSIQKRRLEFVKNEHLLHDFMKHIQKHAEGKLLTSQGAPNLEAITSLSQNLDLDKSKDLTNDEVKTIIREIWTEELHHKGEEAVMKDLDINGNGKVCEEEEFTTWLNKRLLLSKYEGKSSFSERTLDDLFKQRKTQNERNKHLISEISKHPQNSGLGNLLTDDGELNEPVLKRLFHKFDLDKNNCISLSELRTVIQDINFEQTGSSQEEVLAHIMKELDENEDQVIDETEFVNAFRKLLGPKTTMDDIYLEVWKQTEELFDENELNLDSLIKKWATPISLLLLGTVMLSLFSSPLVASVQQISKSAGIPSFFVSFVLIPLATNTRRAMAIISSANKKKRRTTFLAFSEIYGSAFMNNTLGLCLLLAIVYFRGLAWDFSPEVLIIVIISAIMGSIGCLCSRIPIWTCFIAYLLYPFSLAFVYVNIFYGWL